MEMESNLTKGYLDACRLACEELANRDPAEICRNALVSYCPEKEVFYLEYLGETYCINARSGSIAGPVSDMDVTVTVKILLLHYLLHAKNLPLSDRLISFRELTNGAAIYYPAFYKRAVTPLVKTFGANSEDLFTAGVGLKGVAGKYGHACITFNILPRVPVTCVIWEGEEEIPASGTILFDETVEQHLPAEDIACAGSFGVYELMRLKQAAEVLLKA